jgi:TolA-binding protein
MAAEAASLLAEREALGAPLSRETAGEVVEMLARDAAGRGAEAEGAACALARRLGGNGAAASYACGLAFLSRGDHGGAASSFDAVPSSSPLAPYARFGRGQALLLSGDGKGAARAFAEAAEGARPSDGVPALRARRLFAALGEGTPLPGTPRYDHLAPLPSDPPRTALLAEIFRGSAALEGGRAAEGLAAYRRAEGILESARGGRPAGEGDGAAEGGLPYDRAHREARRLAEDGDEEGAAGLLVLLAALPGADGPARPGAPAREGVRGRSMASFERILLGGRGAEEWLRTLEGRLERLRNLPHPLDRYRRLVEVDRVVESLRSSLPSLEEGRAEILAGGEGETSLRPAFRRIGRHAERVVRFGEAVRDSRALLSEHFGGRTAEEGGEGTPGGEKGLLREILALDREGYGAYLDRLRSVRLAAGRRRREAERDGALALRPVVERLLCDALVTSAGRAASAAVAGGKGERGEAPGSDPPELLREATERLRGGAVPSPAERGAVAARAAAVASSSPQLLDGGRARTLLPLLEGGGGEEEAAGAFLLRALGDPAWPAAMRRFLERNPRSPRSSPAAHALANEALRRGNGSEAYSLYEKALDGAPPSRRAGIRYVMAWIRHREGNPEAVLRILSSADVAGAPEGPPIPKELSAALSSLLSSAVKEVPPEELRSRVPRGAASPEWLSALSGAASSLESSRDLSGAAAVRDLLGDLAYPSGGSAADHGRAVELLLEDGRLREGKERLAAFRERYGAGGRKLPPSAAKGAADEGERLATLYAKALLRSASASDDPALAAEAREALRALPSPALLGEEGRKGRLALARSSLRAGDRAEGRKLLDALAAERVGGAVEEQAALLLASSALEDYEARRAPASAALPPVLSCAEAFPSGKSASLALRAASSFLGRGDHSEAVAAAARAEALSPPRSPAATEAALLAAEALFRGGDAEGARGKALSVLSGPLSRGSAEASRGRSLLQLATLRLVDGRAAAKDWKGVGRLYEELSSSFGGEEGARFAREAFRGYGAAGDEEGVLRLAPAAVRGAADPSECAEAARAAGEILERRGDPLGAARLYGAAASRFPESRDGARLAFDAARLSLWNGDGEGARRGFLAFRKRRGAGGWEGAFADLALAWLSLGRDGTGGKESVRAAEGALRRAAGPFDPEPPEEFHRLAAETRLSLGREKASRFRQARLSVPLAKSLDAKTALFESAMELFGLAAASSSPAPSLAGARLGGDLYVDFGKAILASERPRFRSPEERARYEEALSARARTLFERGKEWYASALDRLPPGGAGGEEGAWIRQRMEAVSSSIASLPPPAEATP